MRLRHAQGLLALVAALGLTGAGYAYTAVAVTGRASSTVSFTETASTGFTGVTASVTPGSSSTITFAAGTAANQIDKKWCDVRSISTAGDTLDLAGVLTNEFGATVTFAKVKVISVKAATANAGNVWIGGAAANRFNTFLKDSSVVVVQPGYTMSVMGPGTGYVVTAATGDRLLLKSTSGTASAEVCIAGTSA